jgi:hypothetical protein
MLLGRGGDFDFSFRELHEDEYVAQEESVMQDIPLNALYWAKAP